MIIKCSECGKEVSDKAKTCPNCGSPIPAGQPEAKIEKDKPKGNSVLGILALVFSILGCFFIVGAILAIIDLLQRNGRKKTCSIIALVICGMWLVIGVIGSSNRKSNNETVSTTLAQYVETEAETTIEETETETEIEYISVTADELSDALSSNALKAENDYNDKYIEVSGTLGVIDSGGKYISVDSSKDFDLTNIQCYIKSEEQKQIIMEMSRGDSIIVKGYCKDVGEVLGYQIDIESIEK